MRCDPKQDRSFGEIFTSERAGAVAPGPGGLDVCALLEGGGLRCRAHDPLKNTDGPVHDPFTLGTPVPVLMTPLLR